jgi:myo-inositol-1(or 4)-monophosphatase
MQKDQATLLKAKDAVVAAFKALRPKLLESYGNVENSYKSDKTVVTELDLWVEQEIKTALRTFDSAIGFLGEEHGAEGSTTLRWIIDPIDGTEQFIRGIPICSNMATLADGTDLLVTVIYNFVTDELYWAVKGGGAWLGDKRLSISKRPLERSFVDIGFDISDEEMAAVVMKIVPNIKATTRYYASGHSTCMIASGKTEGRIVVAGKGGPWDYAPGGLLVPEASGVTVQLDGGTYDCISSFNFVSGTKELVEHVRGLL